MNTLDHQNPHGLKQIEVLAICFEEVMETARAVVRGRNIDWRNYRALSTQHDSFGMRIKDVVTHQGTNEKINFRPELKKFMRANCSLFKRKTTPWGSIYFARNVSEDLAFGFTIETVHHYGLGKAFTAQVIIEHVGGEFAGMIWRDDLFRLLNQHRESLCWTYSTRADLLVALESVAQMMHDIAPILESVVPSFFVPLPSVLPNSTLYRGAITAQDAANEAIELAKTWADDAGINSVRTSCHVDVRDNLGPAINIDGTIKPYGFWSFRFCAPSKSPELLLVHVPFAGATSVYTKVIENLTPDTIKFFFSPISYRWINSDQVLKVAESNGGTYERENARECFDILLELSLEDAGPCSQNSISTPSQPTWVVKYLNVTRTGDRADFEINLDALSGEVLGTTGGRT